MISIHLVPDELKAYPQWVCWRYEDRGEEKLTKVPYDPKTNKYADVTRPETWSDFEFCVDASVSFDGVGFVLTDSDPFCFIDLDETENKTWLQKQIEITETMNSYSEVSPSGKGLHVIVKAKLKRGRRRGPFEFYSDSRFMCMTGNVYQHLPIQFAQLAVENLMDEMGFNNELISTSTIDEPQTYDDLTIYNCAANASNGEKFLKLWNGDTQSYHFGDHSRADFAMIDILAYYTKCREQIKRLFRMSGLGKRQKAKREDYVNNMVDRSFDNTTPIINFDTSGFEGSVVKALPPLQKIVEKPPEVYAPSGALSMPPGLLGEIAEFIYQQSYKPVPEMAICAAIGFVAGVCGRAFNVSNTGLNMYILLLARTGRGKEEMARGISKLVSAISQICPTVQDFQGPGDLASGQALLRYLSDHNTGSFVSIFGEFGLKMKTICSSRANAADVMLQKVMLDLFNKSGATDQLLPTVYSDAERNTKVIDSPAFTMIGESTPDWFYDNADESMIRSGLLPRFTVVDYLGKRPPSNPAGQYVKPSTDLVHRIATLVSIVQGLLQTRNRSNVEFSPGGKELSERLDRRADHEINNDDSGISAELWNRAHLKTLRLAAIIAVGKNPYAPVIDEECWIWAERFILSGIESLKKRFDGGIIGSNSDEQQFNDMLLFLQSYLEFRPDSVSITNEMYIRGVISHSYILNTMRRHRCFKNDRMGSAQAVLKTLRALIDSGELVPLNTLQCQQLFSSTGKHYQIRGVLRLK